MSSSSVFQGLRSCLEPRLIEPRVLRLQLAPPGSNEEHDSKTDKNSESGWSFLQSLSDISPNCSKTEDSKAENVYVHPTVKSSSSILSAKSLEMCTESLGSETGSNGSDSSDEISLFSSSQSSTSSLTNKNSGFNRLNRTSSSNYPPPLTSITDLGGFQVRPHREDGRLVLEAVTSSSPQPCFQAERSNGRLRLRVFDSFAFSSDWDDEDDDDDEEEEEEEEDDEMEEYVENAEDEKEVTMFARPSRCKESGKRDIFCDGYSELRSLSLCL